jgi:hypothetical protein
MRVLATLVSLVILAAAAGCGGAGTPETGGPPGLEEALSALDEELREGYVEARRQQEQALESTSAIMADPESATVEQIEEALNTLNRSLLRGRHQAARIRDSDVEGRRLLLRELRRTNAELSTVYQKLVEHHPDPRPELLLKELDESS